MVYKFCAKKDMLKRMKEREKATNISSEHFTGTFFFNIWVDSFFSKHKLSSRSSLSPWLSFLSFNLQLTRTYVRRPKSVM